MRKPRIFRTACRRFFARQEVLNRILTGSPLLVLAASLAASSCAMQAPQDTHVQFPVVAAFANKEEAFQGNIDNNFQTGTAFVDVAGESSGMHCRGEGHLTQLANSASCDGGKGDCNLTCDDGTILTCQYRLTSCTSGTGIGVDQNKNWFAFAFGPDIQQARRDILAQRLQVVAAKLSSATPSGNAPKDGAPDRDRMRDGTGFFVSSEGHTVTAYHVIADSKAVVVLTRSGNTFRAKVVDFDQANDLALLKIDARSRPLAFATSGDVAVGEEVLTIGYPLPDLEGWAQKATFGHINALSGNQDDVRLLQMDAPTQPGNSGGPLLDSRGRVIGVIEGILNEETTMKVADAIPQNVNYALKSDYLLPLLAQYSLKPKFGHVSRTPLNQAALVRQIQESVVMVIAK